MQKTVIKAGQTKRYHVAMAYIDYLKKSNQYEGVLLLGDLKKPMSKKAASRIQVTGDDKTVIEKLLKDIAAVFPPKEDVSVVFLGEIENE